MSDTVRKRVFDVLLVEDNPGDVRLTAEMFRECPNPPCLHVVSNGEDAVAFLRRGPGQADAPRPDLILLDLNLPRKDGRQFLAEVKADPQWRRIPVVVLTTSQAEVDVLQAYDLHANCYLVKPIQLEQFSRIIRSLQEFWLTLATLPGR